MPQCDVNVAPTHTVCKTTALLYACAFYGSYDSHLSSPFVQTEPHLYQSSRTAKKKKGALLPPQSNRSWKQGRISGCGPTGRKPLGPSESFLPQDPRAPLPQSDGDTVSAQNKPSSANSLSTRADRMRLGLHLCSPLLDLFRPAATDAARPPGTAGCIRLAPKQ